MKGKALVTGGAGFVGSYLVDALLADGHEVRILDNLDPQVHGAHRRRPAWLNKEAEFQDGDVRDLDTVRRSLQGIDIVYHLAAAVGVGQSMYQIAAYTATNTLGTANLLQCIVDGRRDLQRVVVASSMSIYGEGRYVRPDGAAASNPRRVPEQLRAHDWEVRDPDGAALSPCPTDEQKPLDPTSIYALTKEDQEKMVLQIGAAYGIPSVALRFFNIYGPRQALSNPYTGVAAIFSSRLLNGQPPLVFEDGEQRRDFVSVHDIVQSLILAACKDDAIGLAVNIGSGSFIRVRDLAATVARALDVDIAPEITQKHRVGDIRNCYADINLARRTLGFQPRVSLEAGMLELGNWLREQERPQSLLDTHAAELTARGLTR